MIKWWKAIRNFVHLRSRIICYINNRYPESCWAKPILSICEAYFDGWKEHWLAVDEDHDAELWNRFFCLFNLGQSDVL